MPRPATSANLRGHTRAAATPAAGIPAAGTAADQCGHGAARCAQCHPVHPAGPYIVDARASVDRAGR